MARKKYEEKYGERGITTSVKIPESELELLRENRIPLQEFITSQIISHFGTAEKDDYGLSERGLKPYKLLHVIGRVGDDLAAPKKQKLNDFIKQSIYVGDLNYSGYGASYVEEGFKKYLDDCMSNVKGQLNETHALIVRHIIEKQILILDEKRGEKRG